MARSRSRSRDRGRRRHSSSDESDYDRRKREKRKKKRRSRSRSADSDRRKYKNSSSASGYSRDRLGQRSSSRSDGRGERSHYSKRDRSRSRSPTERRRKERSKSRSPDERKRRSKSKSPSKERYDGRRKDTTTGDKKKEKDGTPNEGALSLKERIARLTGSSSQGGLDKLSDNATTFKVDDEKIAEIEAQGFHQQTFVSNATKKSNGNINGSKPVETSSSSANSHENAMFGSTFSKTNSTNSLPVNGISRSCSDDELFGPSLLIEQELRTERWLEKLMFIRQKILRESK